jgi:hypothetical protein
MNSATAWPTWLTTCGSAPRKTERFELKSVRKIMSKDAVATMGGLLPDDAGGRDAVHVAVFSAVSDEKLRPGQDVAIAENGISDVKVAPRGELVGIVDPFLKTPVAPGARFWVYLYPRSITGLSHRWAHPAFEETATTYVTPATKLSSEQWLRDFCARSNCPRYDTVMRVIKEGSFSDDDGYISGYIDGDCMHFGGQDASGEIPTEFWVHAENVIGQKAKLKPNYFSCSC